MKNPRSGKEFKSRLETYCDANLRELVCSKIEPNKKEQLTGLLSKYKDVFYSGGKLPIVQVGVEHTVVVKEDSSPVVFKPRRLSRELADEVREHINELLEQGVIKESNSQWASPIMCARKKDGSLRMAIDYRSINEKIKYINTAPNTTY